MVPAPMVNAPARAAAVAVQELLALFALPALPCSAVSCQDENAFGVMRSEELVRDVTLAGET